MIISFVFTVSPIVDNRILSSVDGWLGFLRELKFKTKKLLSYFQIEYYMVIQLTVL